MKNWKDALEAAKIKKMPYVVAVCDFIGGKVSYAPSLKNPGDDWSEQNDGFTFYIKRFMDVTI